MKCIDCGVRLRDEGRPGYPCLVAIGGTRLNGGMTCRKGPAPMFNHHNGRERKL